MTLEQQQAIMRAWKKVQASKDGIRRAAENLKAAGLADTMPERVQNLDAQLQAAIGADAAALEEVEEVMRAAGFNV